jgi:D-tyrosyl-tRNA(Tyr) deacylase
LRVVVQRVSSSKVIVDQKVVGSIGRGLNLLIGISKDDTYEDLKYIKDKVVNLRVFEDEENKMNRSILDIQGEILAISQFTLYGDCRKGRRPNFMNAMGGEDANALYEDFLKMLKESGLRVEKGEFGADMKVDIQNDGPVTILLDSKKEF